MWYDRTSHSRIIRIPSINQTALNICLLSLLSPSHSATVWSAISDHLESASWFFSTYFLRFLLPNDWYVQWTIALCFFLKRTLSCWPNKIKNNRTKILFETIRPFPRTDQWRLIPLSTGFGWYKPRIRTSRCERRSLRIYLINCDSSDQWSHFFGTGISTLQGQCCQCLMKWDRCIQVRCERVDVRYSILGQGISQIFHTGSAEMVAPQIQLA